MSEDCTQLVDCATKDNWDLFSIIFSMVCVDQNGELFIKITE